jgi:hypothetical protein
MVIPLEMRLLIGILATPLSWITLDIYQELLTVFMRQLQVALVISLSISGQYVTGSSILFKVDLNVMITVSLLLILNT